VGCLCPANVATNPLSVNIFSDFVSHSDTPFGCTFLLKFPWGVFLQNKRGGATRNESHKTFLYPLPLESGTQFSDLNCFCVALMLALLCLYRAVIVVVCLMVERYEVERIQALFPVVLKFNYVVYWFACK